MRRKQRLVETAKFYLFDIGVANQLHVDGTVVSAGTDRFGRAFEHFVINEMRAYLAYRGLDRPLSFWRTSSGFEVDLIVGAMDLAIECKSNREARHNDLRGLRALGDEYEPGRRIVVSRVPAPRTAEDGIEIVNWTEFCAALWSDDLIG